MKLKIVFLVDKAKLTFFAKLLKISEKGIFEDSNGDLLCIERLWNRERCFVEELLLKVFNEILKDEIKVFIFPQYFYLGAAETANKIILFGQPFRSEYFPLAIVAHEIGHIFLSKVELKRPVIIDEVICFMLEDYIYSSFDKKSLLDIWNENELDLFHLTAIKIANIEIKERGAIINRNINEIICVLIAQLDEATLNIKPEKGLIKNIGSNSRRGITE